MDATTTDSEEDCINVAGDWIVADSDLEPFIGSYGTLRQSGCDITGFFYISGSSVPSDISGVAYADSVSDPNVDLYIEDYYGHWLGRATSSTIYADHESEIDHFYAFFERM